MACSFSKVRALAWESEEWGVSGGAEESLLLRVGDFVQRETLPVSDTSGEVFSNTEVVWVSVLANVYNFCAVYARHRVFTSKHLILFNSLSLKGNLRAKLPQTFSSTSFPPFPKLGARLSLSVLTLP